MESIILTISVVAGVLVFVLPLTYAFLVYIAVLLYYPDYLRVIYFGLTISAGRIVVAALLLRCLLDKEVWRKFKWSRLDTLVVVADAIYTIILSMSYDNTLAAMKYRSGEIMDTTLAYFAARFIVNSPAQLVSLVEGVAILLIPLALLGAYEACTTTSPYQGLLKYHYYIEKSPLAYLLKAGKGHGGEERYGFFRAQGSFGHPILFGISFALFLPLVWKLLHRASLRIAATIALVAGTLSSLSSGPLIALLIVVGGLAMERFRQYTKTLLVLLVFLCVILEFYTDRPHFYDVFASRLAFDQGTAYARSRLIDAAIKHLPEYWLTGYGEHDPGWGPYVTGMDYTDVCVHYIALLVRYGILGLVAYMTVVLTVLVRLFRLHERSGDARFRSIAWALLVSLMVMLGGHLSVSTFGSLTPLYSIVLGLSGSMAYLQVCSTAPISGDSDCNKQRVLPSC